MNWVWLTFASHADATEFTKRLDAHGLDHRGVYPPDERDTFPGYGVRVRPWEHFEKHAEGLKRTARN